MLKTPTVGTRRLQRFLSNLAAARSTGNLLGPSRNDIHVEPKILIEQEMRMTDELEARAWSSQFSVLVALNQGSKA